MKTITQTITLLALSGFGVAEAMYGNIPVLNQLMCFVFSSFMLAGVLMIMGNEVIEKIKQKTKN